MDLDLHVPHDATDILALQRQSITVRSDSTAWYYGEKRLGGHAYAGYGIFGHSSSADRVDQALAELHTDITVSYLRIEIQYAIRQKKARALYKLSADPKILNPVGPVPNVVPKIPGLTPVDLGSDTGILSTALNVENLSCISFLKSYCGKNRYSRSLLYMEMAKVEEGSEARTEYLQVW